MAASVLTRIIVRDLGETIDDSGHTLEILRRNFHRRERKRAAETLGVVHRPETGERTVFQQYVEPLHQLILGQAQCRGDFGIRPFADGKIALQPIDDGAIHGIHQDSLFPDV